MTLNALPVTSAVRHPRAIVKLNGRSVPGWISWEVQSNAFFEADTWRVSYAVSLLPKKNDASWFSEPSETFVEIFAGFPAEADNPDVSELDSLIYGRVDNMEYDPGQRTITLTGRDLTA